MLTKKQLCEYVLREHMKKNYNSLDFTQIPKEDIFKSSTIAVAMEYLGLLTHDELLYSQTRGGTFKISFEENGEPRVISFREILNSMKE